MRPSTVPTAFEPTVLTNDADSPPPTVIGEHYVVDRELGRGGMSTVYLCTDRRDGSQVAVKILRQEIGSKVVVDRFLREIAYSSELDHPRIPKVLGSGVVDGLPYYAMTYIPGESLRTRLEREKQLPLSDAIEIACEVIAPTSYAHECGIVHRDIKPENILLSVDGVYVLDFGIARAIVESGVDRLTSTGVGVGTPAYMSPEQATGERNIDARSDVYSIGCVLYEMITGLPPFVGPTAQVVISRRFAATAPPMRELREQVPEWLESIVTRALAKAPADRWPSAAALAEALRNPVVVQSLSSTRKPQWRRSTVRAVAGTAGVAAIALAATVAREYTWGAQSPRASTATGISGGLGRIVVAPLENQTDDPKLDGIGVRAAEVIADGLQAMDSVQVVPSDMALAATKRLNLGRSDGRMPLSVHALASETAAGTVISGSYYLAGQRIVFRVTVAADSGTRILRALTDITAPRSAPDSGVAEIRERLKGWFAIRNDDRLVGAAPAADQPPTYAAYQIFSAALTKYLAIDNANALPLFLRAFSIDTSFNVALLYASIAMTNLAQWARADSLLQNVNGRRQVLSPYNQAWLDYRLGFIHGDHETALAAIRKAAELEPESKAAYNHAGEAYDAGYYREALTAIEGLSPDRGPMRGFFGYWGIYCSTLHALGLYDREYKAGLEAGKRFPDRLTKFTPLVRSLIGEGRLDSLGILTRAAQGVPADKIGWDYGHLLNEVAEELNGHGHPDSAAVYFEHLRKWLVANDNGPGTQFRLVRTLYALGRYSEARTLLLSLRQQNHDHAEYLGMTGLLYARTNNEHLARLVADSLARSKAPYELGMRPLYRARIAAVLGDWDEAVARIREAFADGLPHNLGLHRDNDFEGLRSSPPFLQLLQSKG